MGNWDNFENIDPKDTIVDNDDKLMEFKKRLKGQYELVERGEKPSKDDMDKIIADLEDLKKVHQKRLWEKDREKYQRIINDFNKLFNMLSEDCDDYGVFTYFINSRKNSKNDVNEHFYIRKIYQLSNSFGVYEDVIIKSDVHEDIKMYYFLFLFLDSYESFGSYIHPIFKKFWKKTGHYVSEEYTYKPKDIFRNFSGIIEGYDLSLGIDVDLLHKNYRWLRNHIAHSSLVIQDQKFEFYDKNRDIGDVEIDEAFDEMETFLLTMILYATSFDIFFLKLYKSESKDETWDKYLDIYWNAWKNIGEKVD